MRLQLPDPLSAASFWCGLAAIVWLIVGIFAFILGASWIFWGVYWYVFLLALGIAFFVGAHSGDYDG